MELDDLIKNIKDFFIAHAPGTTDGKTFLAFEPLGHMMSPDDFKFNGAFDPTIAASEVTVLSNFVPEIADTLNPDLLQSAIDTYASMVSSMAFYDKNISGDKTPYMAQFGAMQSDAMQKMPTFDPVTLTGSTIIANPSTWYDPNSNVWTPKTFTQATKTPTSGPVGLNVGALNNLKLQWKINPTSNVGSNATVQKLFNNSSIVTKINLMAEKNASQTVSSGAMHLAGAQLSSVAIKSHPATAVATAVFRGPIKVNTVPVIDKQLLHTINLSVPLIQRIGLIRQIGKPANIQNQNVDSSSSGFEISFSYCMVTLQRPWMTPNVFNLSKIWFSLTQKAGFYSTGEMTAANKGVLRALPKAMIVIKDLTIKASQWSENDKAAATSAIGFGAFNVTGSSFNSSSKALSAPGIQVIGWICEVLPKLPMNDDTNII